MDLTLLLMVALLIPIGFQLTASLVTSGAYEPSFNWVIVLHKWFEALLLVSLAAYFVYRHGLPAAGFGLQADRLGKQALWAVPTVLAVYVVFTAMLLAIGMLVLLYPPLEKDLLRRTQFLELLPLNDLPATILLLVPVAIHEELLFRGLLIPYLRRIGCGWGLAILVSTTVFAALHIAQGWLGVVQIFGVGAMLGLFFVLSRSLLPVIIAHFAFNLLQFQLARFLLPWLEQFAHNA